jgi:hypothetical protein
VPESLLNLFGQSAFKLCPSYLAGTPACCCMDGFSGRDFSITRMTGSQEYSNPSYFPILGQSAVRKRIQHVALTESIPIDRIPLPEHAIDIAHRARIFPPSVWSRPPGLKSISGAAWAKSVQAEVMVRYVTSNPGRGCWSNLIKRPRVQKRHQLLLGEEKQSDGFRTWVLSAQPPRAHMQGRGYVLLSSLWFAIRC